MADRANVLIVDDEPRVLDSLEALLAMDYCVLRADEPKAALSRLTGTEVAGPGAGLHGGARGRADLAGRPPPQQRWR